MGKGKDKAGKKGGGQASHGDKVRERSERARLRKDRQRNSQQSQYCSDADDREFEAQVCNLISSLIIYPGRATL